MSLSRCGDEAESCRMVYSEGCSGWKLEPHKQYNQPVATKSAVLLTGLYMAKYIGLLCAEMLPTIRRDVF